MPVRPFALFLIAAAHALFIVLLARASMSQAPARPSPVVVSLPISAPRILVPFAVPAERASARAAPRTPLPKRIARAIDRSDPTDRAIGPAVEPSTDTAAGPPPTTADGTPPPVADRPLDLTLPRPMRPEPAPARADALTDPRANTIRLTAAEKFAVDLGSVECFVDRREPDGTLRRVEGHLVRAPGVAARADGSFVRECTSR